MAPVMKGFVVYGRVQPPCRFCTLAKVMLDDIGAPWVFIDVTKDKQAMDKLKSLGLRTVPQIWFGDEHIGGYSELEIWKQSHVPG